MAKYTMSFYDTREALRAAVEALDTDVPVSIVPVPGYSHIWYILTVGTAPTP